MLTTCSPVPVLVTISLRTILSILCVSWWCVKRFAAVCNLRPGSAVVVCVASPAIECRQNWTDGSVLLPLFVIDQLAGPSKSGLLLYHLLMSFEIWSSELTMNEATCQQTGHHLFLPTLPAETDSWNTTSTAVWCSSSCRRSSWVVLTTATPSWSFFRGLPSSILQRVQTAAAQLVMGLHHVTMLDQLFTSYIGCQFLCASSSSADVSDARESMSGIYQRSRDISQLRPITAPTPFLWWHKLHNANFAKDKDQVWRESVLSCRTFNLELYPWTNPFCHPQALF